MCAFRLYQFDKGPQLESRLPADHETMKHGNMVAGGRTGAEEGAGCERVVAARLHPAVRRG